MTQTLITVIHSANGNRTLYPYQSDDTIGSLLADLGKGGFLRQSQAGFVVKLQPGDVSLDQAARIAELPLGQDTALVISERTAQSSAEVIPGIVLGTDREQQTPCVLILDHSYSMAANGKMDHLNAALHAFGDHISKHDDTRRRVRLLLIKCGGGVEKSSDWMEAAEFEPPTLVPQGDTPLGAAVSLGLEEIERIKQRYKLEKRPYTRPIMVIMTDGQPTDDHWEAVAQQARTRMAGKHVQIWPVPILGIGDSGASPDALRQFKTTDGPMICINSLENFSTFFTFLADALKVASNSAPGTQSEVAIDRNDRSSAKISVMS